MHNNPEHHGTVWTHGTTGTREGKATCHRCPGSYLHPDYPATGYRTNLDEPLGTGHRSRLVRRVRQYTH